MEKKRNLWIIPTDKPSRLFIDIDDNKLKLCTPLGGEHMMNQNIYITDDSEIKDGEEFWYNNGGEWYKAIYRDYYKNLFPYGKKIILTTDDQLIKDGVQAIDDEFLEWFVKNPSCERVEVEGLNIGDGKTGYVICKPKEEPKYISITERMKPLQEQWQKEMEESLNKHELINLDKMESKLNDALDKETLENDVNTQEWGFENFITSEEDAKIFIDAMIKHPEPNEKLKKAFREYGKQETLEYDLLQHIKFALECKNESQAIRLIEKYGFEKQEQNSDKKYSEDEVYNLLEQAMKDAPIKGLTHHYDGDFRDLKEWFEQFKNK